MQPKVACTLSTYHPAREQKKIGWACALPPGTGTGGKPKRPLVAGTRAKKKKKKKQTRLRAAAVVVAVVAVVVVVVVVAVSVLVYRTKIEFSASFPRPDCNATCAPRSNKRPCSRYLTYESRVNGVKPQ